LPVEQPGRRRKRISIDVEMVGPGLMVQHWTEDIAEKQHYRLLLLSDMFVRQERIKVQLSWDLAVKPLSESGFETDEYLAFVEKSGASLEQVNDTMQRVIDAHSAEETPNFAKSIER
jgi:hypothetical protein